MDYKTHLKGILACTLIWSSTFGMLSFLILCDKEILFLDSLVISVLCCFIAGFTSWNLLLAIKIMTFSIKEK